MCCLGLAFLVSYFSSSYGREMSQRFQLSFAIRIRPIDRENSKDEANINRSIETSSEVKSIV